MHCEKAAAKIKQTVSREKIVHAYENVSSSAFHVYGDLMYVIL